MAKYTVTLPERYPLPRRCGGVIYEPGVPVECDEIPPAIQADLDRDATLWDVTEIGKRSHKKHEEPEG